MTSSRNMISLVTVTMLPFMSFHVCNYTVLHPPKTFHGLVNTLKKKKTFTISFLIGEKPSIKLNQRTA